MGDPNAARVCINDGSVSPYKHTEEREYFPYDNDAYVRGFCEAKHDVSTDPADVFYQPQRQYRCAKLRTPDTCKTDSVCDWRKDEQCITYPYLSWITQNRSCTLKRSHPLFNKRVTGGDLFLHWCDVHDMDHDLKCAWMRDAT